MNTSRTTRRLPISSCLTFFSFLALFLISAPAPAASVTVAATDANSITLTWTAPGDDGASGRAAQYDIRYALAPITAGNFDSATTGTDAPAPAIAGAIESFTVTGLNPGTTYYFAIKTADEALNWSTLSNIASATTATASDTTTPAAVANLHVLNPTTSSLTLAWFAPGDDGASGTAAQYDIRYSTAPINNTVKWNTANQLSTEPIPSPAGTPETLTVTGLTEATTYYFALKTADEVPNWSPMSNVPFGTTASDETPPAAVVDLRASAGTVDSTIEVLWTATGDDGFLGAASAYELRYALAPITETNWSQAALWPDTLTPFASGLEHHVTLTGLQPGEIYYVALKAYDDALNASPLSNVDTAVAAYGFSTGIDDEETLPSAFTLEQNYPNPFNPSTEIRLTLPTAAHAELTIYNTTGQAVAHLIDGPLSPGTHHVTWNGCDDHGRPVATGVYYYRLAAADHVETKKMVLLK